MSTPAGPLQAGLAQLAAAGRLRQRREVASRALDGTRVRVSDVTELRDAIVIASRTAISRDQFAPYEGWFKKIEPVGSIAWKLACIAAGQGDLNVSVAPKNEWDVCAGDVLVREAGGIYVGFDGSKRVYNQAKTLIEAGMAAGSPALVHAFLGRDRARET